jgi:branched-chain amino acid transport system substrate-binding protein
MRRFATMLAAAGAALGLTFAAPAWAKTIRIGIITTYSGPLAPPGISMDRGLTLYAKLHAKDLPKGVKVRIIRRDDTGIAPATAKRLAQELVTRDHVQFLAGSVYSPDALAIAPLATEAKVPFVVMNAAAADLVRKSPYVVRDSFTLWQVAMPMGEWAAKHGMGDAYTAVSDYAPGWDAEGGFIAGIKAAGGKIVGSVRFPLNNPDFAPVLQRIKDLHPHTLFIFVPGGPQSTQMMKTFNALGLAKAGIHLVTTQDLVIDSELPKMGNIPLGVVSSGTYQEASKRPANRAFVAAFQKAYPGSVPDFPAMQGWDGMAMIFRVIRQTGGTFTPAQAMAILSHYSTTNSPRGPFHIDPATRDVVENVYIRRVEKLKNGQLANVRFDTFPMVSDPWAKMHPQK